MPHYRKTGEENAKKIKENFQKRKVRVVTAQRRLLIKEEREEGRRGDEGGMKRQIRERKREREKLKYSNWKLFGRPRKIIENVHAVCEVKTKVGSGEGGSSKGGGVIGGEPFCH